MKRLIFALCAALCLGLCFTGCKEEDSSDLVQWYKVESGTVSSETYDSVKDNSSSTYADRTTIKNTLANKTTGNHSTVAVKKDDLSSKLSELGVSGAESAASTAISNQNYITYLNTTGASVTWVYVEEAEYQKDQPIY